MPGRAAVSVSRSSMEKGPVFIKLVRKRLEYKGIGGFTVVMGALVQAPAIRKLCSLNY